MANVSKQKIEDQKVKFPAGFRFHPTDEELINQYLVKKVDDNRFCAIAIAEVDMNKCEPWDFPDLAKLGETEWYYFCLRDRKYPSGQRTNRATNAGYWKATGKDKEIIKENALIGMKKTLVFYIGRAPKGERTNWVMHEYRLEGNKLFEINLSKPGMGEWVICRVYEKGSHGNKMHGSNLGMFNSSREGPLPNDFVLPPLMDSSTYNTETKITTGEFSQVMNSFTIPYQTQNQITQNDNIVHSNETSLLNIVSSSKQIDVYPLAVEATLAASNQYLMGGNAQYSNCLLSQEQSMLRVQLENENYGSSSKQSLKQEFSLGRDFDADISSVVYGNEMFQNWFGNEEILSPNSTGPVVTDSLWNF